jgi:hypothetical protein
MKRDQIKSFYINATGKKRRDIDVSHQDVNINTLLYLHGVSYFKQREQRTHMVVFFDEETEKKNLLIDIRFFSYLYMLNE